MPYQRGFFLSDREVQRWYRSRKEKYPQFYEADSSIYGTRDTQYAFGTVLHGTSRNFVIMGSHMEMDWRGEPDEPKYDVIFEGGDEFDVLTIPMEEAHENYQLLSDMEDLFAKLNDTSTIPDNPVRRLKKVLFLGISELVVDGTYRANEELWGGVTVDDKDDHKPFLNIEEDNDGSPEQSFYDYEALVIQDEYFDCCFVELAVTLRNYYRNGGSVIVLGVHGIYSAPESMNKVFGCQWRFAAYTAFTFQTTEAAKTLFQGKVETVEYTKANLLSVSPLEEAMYLPIPVEENDSEGSDDDDPTEPPKLTPVAIHTEVLGEASKAHVAYVSMVRGVDEWSMVRELIVNVICNQQA